MENQTTVYRLGFWSALLASVFSLAYDVGQLLEWLGLLPARRLKPAVEELRDLQPVRVEYVVRLELDDQSSGRRTA